MTLTKTFPAGPEKTLRQFGDWAQHERIHQLRLRPSNIPGRTTLDERMYLAGSDTPVSKPRPHGPPADDGWYTISKIVLGLEAAVVAKLQSVGYAACTDCTGGAA